MARSSSHVPPCLCDVFDQSLRPVAKRPHDVRRAPDLKLRIQPAPVPPEGSEVRRQDRAEAAAACLKD